jgi:hypothetical protein
MSLFQVVVEEYLFPIDALQGNVNVAGLVFDETLESRLEAADIIYQMWIEQIEESLGVVAEYKPYHHCVCEDTFNFEEIKYGIPTRVRSFHVDVVHTPPVNHIDCCYMQVDILHGVDTFYEECADGLYFLADGHFSEVYTPYCYESFDIAMEVPTGFLYAIWLVSFKVATAHINLRHTVVQEYYFNSKAYDYFFAYDKYAWGWDKYLAEDFDITLWLRGAYGRSINEVFTPHLALISSWTGNQDVLEQIMAYDQAIFEKFYTKAVEESLGLAVSMDVDSRMIHTAIESLALGETPIPEVQRFLQAVESLAVTQAASVTFGHCPGVVESLDLVNSPELLRVIPQVLVDVAELLDDPVSKWLALCLLQETINDSDKAIR